ncbi:U3 small nucleolar ribonucleoprotein protein MPP10 [Pieris napi]|uniref:U3 small nucleolar ribonucleoprotein protein MPP10 n=1 Tax=Pieris napi TaxID=78633 RepID=UPI001FBB4E09|nr:U3 small nucleolar ribonucleoprotein protein MPP10 [Pieris napi]
MEHLIEKFSDITAKPVNYLAIQNDIKGDVKNLIKTLYDFTKSEEKTHKKSKGGALQDLIIEELDEEQIWQQIELQNSECWDHLVWEVANCISNKNDLSFPIDVPELEHESDDEEMQEMQEKNTKPEEDEISFPSKSSGRTNQAKKERKPHKKSSIVDDQFFKLQEMEQFLINEEKMEEKGKKKDDDEESINLFEDIDEAESEDDEDVMYKDFFNDDDSYVSEENNKYDEGIENGDVDDQDMPDEDIASDLDNDGEDTIPKNSDKKVRFTGLQPDTDSESDSHHSNTEVNNTVINKDEKKSEFELRQERLKQQISRLEEKSIKEAPWQLKGEVDATKRPQNSLLQEVVDFDLTTRPAPIITEQTTVTLEGLIRQRIKDKAWDDVEKKEKPVDDQLAFKKPEILDHSKSKLSLAQVYEAEYLKQKQAASGDIQEEDEPESHKEIRDIMSKLFAKLDALCHYHYTPKAPQAEVKIISNTPAISMEEVAPVATSDAALLAPEEVKKKHKGDLMSKEERTQTDKNRERRKKKMFQKKKGQVMKVTDHRNTIKGVEANDKSLKTSKAFFQQLNDDATSLIKKNKNKNK